MPVFCGAAFKNKGVQQLLDGVVDFLPSPLEIVPVQGHTPHHGEDRSTRKSFNGFTPLGPVLVTADEIPDPHNLQLKLWVNGELRQDGNSKDMIWNIPKLVEYASHVMTLYPGDVVSTGTPDGVGPLKAGDEVTIEIERIGRMSVKVELKKP